MLHVVYSLSRGGAETQLSYLSTGLAELGWDVHIAFVGRTPGSELNEARAVEAGATLHRFEAAHNHDPMIVLQLRRMIRQIQPDVLQTWLTMMDVMGGLAALTSRVPWILTERNAEIDGQQGMKSRLRRWLGRRAAAIVANSQAGLDLWNGAVDDRLERTVIRNALPIEELDVVMPIDRDRDWLPPDRALIIYAGRLEPQKNIEVTLDSLAEVVTRRDACALLFGRGPQDRLVDEFIESKGLAGRLKRMGFVTDLWRWLKAADVFVSVSHFEGMPNTVMETMALGRPIVVSDIPQHREICEEGDVLFVDRTDPGAVATAIIDCLDDREAAARRARSAQEHARQWTIAAASAAYDDVYRRSMAASSHRSCGHPKSR